jgi:hypothetical protein
LGRGEYAAKATKKEPDGVSLDSKSPDTLKALDVPQASLMVRDDGASGHSYEMSYSGLGSLMSSDNVGDPQVSNIGADASRLDRQESPRSHSGLQGYGKLGSVLSQGSNSPAHQIAPITVTMMLGSGSKSVTVTLDPAELGRVEVKIGKDNDTTTVQIAADRPETLAMLQRDVRQLDAALDQAGISSEGRSINFSLSDPGNGGSAFGRDQRGGQPGSRDSDNTEKMASPTAQFRRVSSLLDLAI